MALWRYADWAKCVEDGWVLRLVVPGQDAFSDSAGSQGLARDAETPGSTRCRMLQGHFINLDAGRLQDSGSYPIPAAAVAATEVESRLRHFDPAEFLTLGGSHFGGGPAHRLNAPPPETLWPNVVPTARLLDALRESLGVPVTISSAFRTAAYNRAAGGAANSWHPQFIACDITANGASPREVADTLAEMRGQRLFRGGIGRYSSFTHVGTCGVNADWTGEGRDPQGQTETTVETASRKLSELAATIPIDTTRPGGRPRATESGDIGEADAAVNGAQILALDHRLPAELRRAVLYSTQFAQHAADAAADPVEDHEGWRFILTLALRPSPDRSSSSA
ncbi:MAG TPA: D-Ala-D-Ala carboxypeptidase family metallohydrolase [Paracoccus sp. (in: a-proteobacteria)]|uniref:D-Ala-D-Ala carboxypeptidase family metallohydrolase n=1 Tax=Paracoccus sp. TaxID=267 RepID=UPI002B9E1ED2|nr:D-Ala-D-Ala carboxypeptidase family metallohydrolase [Paracoccus sp. (in: a-proteobacteria)]HWL58330.1 D-Ala-D-Ala carboxypeptidase family metallohydrolase [Paracoccus sp. (in: a-proteobacteria)]